MFGLEKIKGKIPVAVTIAGSDTGGGAGIQADLKTFAALGVHGTTAITSITAQNTRKVTAVVDLDIRIIREQIRTVAKDMGINAGKTGMLHTEEIIKAVSSEVASYGFPLTVDPVMIAKSGASLLKPEAMNALRNHLLPRATIVTPNRFEAEKLADMKIENTEHAKMAARKISQMGPQAVVVKGGHLNEKDAVDVLYYRDEFKVFRAPRLNVKTTHGTGCSFSAAIAAELAKGEDIPTAVETAKRLVTLAIKFGLDIGKGYGPVNPMAHLYRESSKYTVLMDIEKAKMLLESTPTVAELVAQVGMNIAMSIPYAENVDDVAAIEGRIVKVSSGVKAVGFPKFGCSSHLASYILEATKHDSAKRAAVNLKFSDKALKFLEGKGLKVSFYDRKEEPEDIKRTEGMTIPWGVEQAIKRIGKVPDVIYHRGDMGKEPMIVVLGKKASELAKLVTQVATEVCHHES
jgi:hydroxymethylpyrimidine/phosphomethylpyrimidine kinase